jgi:hypothetical protein
VSFCILVLLFLVNYVSVLLKSFIIFCSLVLHLLYFAEKSQEFVTKPMSRWRSCIGPVIHLAAYKRRQSLQCHSDCNNSSKTLLTLSLSTKTNQHHKNPEKAQEHDEQIHHPQTLTEFSYHQTHQSSSNSSHNRIKNIAQHRIPHQFHKKPDEFARKRKKLSEIPKNRHHQAYLRNSNEDSSITTKSS